MHWYISYFYNECDCIPSWAVFSLQVCCVKTDALQESSAFSLDVKPTLLIFFFFPTSPVNFPQLFAIKLIAQIKTSKSVEFIDWHTDQFWRARPGEAVGAASAANRPSFHTGSHPRGLGAAHQLPLIVSCCSEVASLGCVACSEQGPVRNCPHPSPSYTLHPVHVYIWVLNEVHL